MSSEAFSSPNESDMLRAESSGVMGSCVLPTNRIGFLGGQRESE